MNAEGFEQHHHAEDQQRVHRAILQVDVLLNRFHVAHRQLAHDEGADAVADEDEGNGEGEGEGAEDAVDGECGVDGFQIENFTDVAAIFVAGEEFLFRLLCVVFESMRNKERGRSHNGAEGHHWGDVDGEPDNRGEENGDYGVEPQALARKEFFVRKAKVFFFKEQPVEEQEQQECSAAGKEDWRCGFHGEMHERIAAHRREQSSDRAKAWHYAPHNQPWEQSTDDEHGEEHAPEQEPFSALGAHGLQHFGVNDGIINTGDDLEGRETDDSEDGGEHRNIFESPLVIPA